MEWLYKLTACPLCKEQPSTSVACCSNCEKTLFSPSVYGNEASLGIYQGKLERAIRAFKYNHVTRLGQLFGQTLAQTVKEHDWQVDSVCAVPLHWRRFLERGYNQAALIAKPLAKDLNVSYSPLLSRTRYTQQQAKLAGLERKKNVYDAFQCQPVNGQVILLIDDVYTTGATLEACKSALQQCGAKAIYTACVAKAIKRPHYVNRS